MKTPNEVMNILRLADTGEFRSILEQFQQHNPSSYEQLVSLIEKYPFKRTKSVTPEQMVNIAGSVSSLGL